MKQLTRLTFLVFLVVLAALLAACAPKAPLATATPGGKSVPGPVVSTAVASSGSLPSPVAVNPDQVVVEWRRTGGIAGVCRNLTIQADGRYVLEDCRPNGARYGGTLPAEQKTQLQKLISLYGPFQWETPKVQGSADMFNENFTFAGLGSVQPSADEQLAVNNFLVQAANYASTNASNTILPGSPAAPATGTATPPAGESGIEGQATLGPACAGPVQAGKECPDQPYQATLTILDAAGNQVEQVQTAADGTFRIPLPPGTYTLHPETTGAFPTAADQTVTVNDGSYTQVIVAYDSGIR